MNATQKLTIYLLRCALNKKIPDAKKLENADFDAIMSFAEHHSISALVSRAVSSISEYEGLMTDEQMKKWKRAKNNAVRHFMLQKQEAQNVFDALEEAKIAYLPLKGCILSKYYEFGLREMSDVDILFDKTRQEDSRDIMVKLGYEITEFGEDYHDAYFKPPMYNVELHRYLFAPEKYPAYIEYYSDIFERSQKRKGREYEYVLDTDEFYIFVMTHAVKHFDGPGTGLRSLADLYIYEKREELDEDRLRDAFERLGTTKSASLLRRLANTVFDEENDLDALPLSEEEFKKLDFIIESGTHGSDDHRLDKKIKEVEESDDVRKAKLKYVRGRMKLTPRQIEITYPFFYKHKWARPFLIFGRIHRGLTVNRKKLHREMDMLKKK